MPVLLVKGNRGRLGRWATKHVAPRNRFRGIKSAYGKISRKRRKLGCVNLGQCSLDFQPIMRICFMTMWSIRKTHKTMKYRLSHADMGGHGRTWADMAGTANFIPGL